MRIMFLKQMTGCLACLLNTIWQLTESARSELKKVRKAISMLRVLREFIAILATVKTFSVLLN